MHLPLEEQYNVKSKDAYLRRYDSSIVIIRMKIRRHRSSKSVPSGKNDFLLRAHSIGLLAMKKFNTTRDKLSILISILEKDDLRYSRRYNDGQIRAIFRSVEICLLHAIKIKFSMLVFCGSHNTYDGIRTLVGHWIHGRNPWK